jgi:hypothetical protein
MDHSWLCVQVWWCHPHIIIFSHNTRVHNNRIASRYEPLFISICTSICVRGYHWWISKNVSLSATRAQRGACRHWPITVTPLYHHTIPYRIHSSHTQRRVSGHTPLTACVQNNALLLSTHAAKQPHKYKKHKTLSSLQTIHQVQKKKKRKSSVIHKTPWQITMQTVVKQMLK